MIRRFYIHNFRCLENFELPISGKSSVLLIGKNGAGKSTVGHALRVLQEIAQGQNRVGKLVKTSDFNRGRTDTPLRIEIEVELNEQILAYHLAFELPAGFRESRVAEESLTCDGAPVYTREAAQVTLARGETDQDARFLVDWHLVALPIIQEQSQADPLYAFKNWLSRLLILAPIPSLMNGESHGDTLLPAQDCSNFAEWFTGLMAHSPSAYSSIDKTLRLFMDDLQDLKNPVIGHDTRDLVVQFKSKSESVSIRFQDLSDGEKCFSLSAMVIAASEANGPICCFWDEPDSHLALSEVGHFITDLRRVMRSGSQFIATSHREECIRHFSAENTLFLHRRSHLEPTLVRHVSDLTYSGSLVDALIQNGIEP